VSTKLPASIVPAKQGVIGLLFLAGAWLAIFVARPLVPAGSWVILLAAALPLLLLESRLSGRPAPNRREPQPAVWLLGFLAGSAPFVAIHSIRAPLSELLISWIVILPAFLIKLWFERWRPFTGTPVLIGHALLRRDWKALVTDDVRLWAIKAFFMPVYATWLFGLATYAPTYDLSGIGFVFFAVAFAYAVDLAFALAGCTFATRTTLFSTQPRLLGWVACLLCYPPFLAFWEEFHRVGSKQGSWPSLLNPQPLAVVGGIIMAALLLLYVWATVVFGLRFSNLTNRGVITSGPYRLMKHPAYFAHVANTWIVTFILFPAAGLRVSVHTMMIPLAFTAIYWLRAITEEQHLSESDAYREYAAWIAEHGLLARLKKAISLTGASKSDPAVDLEI
jgi:protein-S-isoprenylcysteine O-methyltransferase Ste14